jgi:hypothetical protein
LSSHARSFCDAAGPHYQSIERWPRISELHTPLPTLLLKPLKIIQRGLPSDMMDKYLQFGETAGQRAGKD